LVRALAHRGRGGGFIAAFGSRHEVQNPSSAVKRFAVSLPPSAASFDSHSGRERTSHHTSSASLSWQGCKTRLQLRAAVRTRTQLDGGNRNAVTRGSATRKRIHDGSSPFPHRRPSCPTPLHICPGSSAPQRVQDLAMYTWLPGGGQVLLRGQQLKLDWWWDGAAEDPQQGHPGAGHCRPVPRCEFCGRCDFAGVHGFKIHQATNPVQHAIHSPSGEPPRVATGILLVLMESGALFPADSCRARLPGDASDN
jgi:hypothetical protein